MHKHVKFHLPGVILYVFHGGFVCGFSFLMFDKCFPGFFTANLVLFTYDVIALRGLDTAALLKLYAVVLAFVGGGLGSLVMNNYRERKLLPYQSLWRMAFIETLLMLVFATGAAIYQYHGAPKSDWLVYLLAAGVFFSGGWQYQSVSSWNNVPFRSNMMSGNMHALSASIFNALWLRVTGRHMENPEEFRVELSRVSIILGFALVFMIGAAVCFFVAPALQFYCGIINVLTCGAATLCGKLLDT